MNITFISKPIFFHAGLRGGVYPVRLSSRLRGEEIAEYLGGVYTLDGNYDEGGIRIHLKPRHLKRVKDGDYVDVIDDAQGLIPHLKNRPKVKVIAYNKPYYDFLKEELPNNEIFLIPHPHINFENKKRVKNKTLIGGMIGKSSPAGYEIFNPIRDALANKGIEIKDWFTYENRKDILGFYKHSDFQVIWYNDVPEDIRRFYRYPGKIINAAAFGIPTLAQKILGHSEMEGFYIPVETHEDIVREALKLQDKKYYDQWSKKLIEKAKEYHISEVAKLYKDLK